LLDFEGKLKTREKVSCTSGLILNYVKIKQAQKRSRRQTNQTERVKAGNNKAKPIEND
jgi:hypothetical protein